MPPKKPKSPADQPSQAGRRNASTTVTLPRRHHDWIARQGTRQRSALIQKGLDYLSAPDRAAWLAQHEETDVLRRALAAKEALES